tara:strand:- start:2847 stop:3206 length:360 start_codon:yes stop_codon:yes gene_type:complete
MSLEEIIRMARETGFSGLSPSEHVDGSGAVYAADENITDELERFAHLVAAAERKRCTEEIEALRNANEAFAARQEWWNARMIELEAAVAAEREACAAIAYLGDTTDAIYKCIRARGKQE